MHNITIRPWIARLLIGIVIAWNLQSAFVFIFFPGRFVNAYELSGTAGEAAIRGFGVLFLMWNVPYLFALKDPVRYQLALTFALLMQSIGLSILSSNDDGSNAVSVSMYSVIVPSSL